MDTTITGVPAGIIVSPPAIAGWVILIGPRQLIWREHIEQPWHPGFWDE